MPALPIILTLQGEDAVAAGIKRFQNDTKKAAGAAGASMDSAAKRTYNSWQNASNSLETRSKKVRDTMERVAKSATAQLGAGASVGLRLASNHFVELGQNAVETENLVSESFGKQLDGAKTWSRGLQSSMGVNALEAQRNAGTFNVMFDSMKIGEDKALGMSKGLTGLAYDMASFYNLSPDEAFEKLRAGITGEAEPLKALGVLINEETVKQYAYQNGIAETGAKLTEQQKVLARYAAIMDQTKKAQGDMFRTKDSGANVTRRFEAAKTILATDAGRGGADVRNFTQRAALPVLSSLASHPEITRIGGAGVEIASQLTPILTFTATLGQSMPVWEKLTGEAGLLAKAGPAAGRGLAWARTALHAESLAAIFNGDVNLATAAKVKLASVTSSASLGSVGAALGLLAIAAYGVNETIAGLKNVTTLSDDDLDKKGWAGEMQRKWGHKMSWLYGGEGESDADKESARIFALGRQRAINRRFGQKQRDAKASQTSATRAVAALAKADDGPDGMSELQRLKWQKAQYAAAKSKDKAGAAMSLEITRLSMEESIHHKADAAAKKVQSTKERAAKAAQRAADKIGKAEERAVLKEQKAGERAQARAIKEQERAGKKHETAVNKYHAALIGAQNGKDPNARLAALAQNVKDTALDGIPGADSSGANAGDFYANKLIVGGRESGGGASAASATANALNKMAAAPMNFNERSGLAAGEKVNWAYTAAGNAYIDRRGGAAGSAKLSPEIERNIAAYGKEATNVLSRMGYAAAAALVAKKSNLFEKPGGFENEVQQEAYRRALKNRPVDVQQTGYQRTRDRGGQQQIMLTVRHPEHPVARAARAYR